MANRDWVAAFASFYMSLSLIDDARNAKIAESLSSFGYDFAAENFETVAWLFAAIWFLIALDYLRKK